MTVVLAKSIGSGSTFVHEAPNDSSAGDGTTSHLIDRHNHDSQQQQSKTATVGNGTDVHATGSKHTTEAPMRATLVAQGVPYATNNFSLRDNVAIENLSSSMHADPQHQGAATAWTHSKQQEEAYNHHSHEHHAGTAAANGGHGHDHDQGPEDLPFYSPPRQRQRWGDTQIAPHTNWGDIFFDLFYVAAAYNLGTVLSTDPTATGLMYTVALFFPILSLWLFKTYYDARFYYHDDVFHRGYEIALLMGLATAVLHIKPVKFLSQPTVYQDIYMYGVGLSVASLLAVGKLVEIMACQRYMKSQTGLHPEAFTAVIFDFWSYLTTGLVYAAATGYAGWRFHRTSIQDDNDRQLLRSLAAASAEEAPHSLRETDHVTVWILLAGLVKTVAMYLIRLANKMNSKHDHKARTVPINVDYAIHRYGEWVMLMLGESVLSLLVVDIVDTMNYYKAFVCGIISIIMGQYLHFQSAPSDPDQHAVRRSVGSSFLFYWLFQIYSLALIILGVSYKMSLLELATMEEETNGGVRRRNMLTHDGVNTRFLATTVDPELGLSASERQQHIAHLFSGSLAVIFFCSDAMSLAHRGIRTQIKRCECADTKLKQFLLGVLVICRVVLFVFIASLSQIITDPSAVIFIGTFTVLAQVGVRLVGSYVFHNEEERELKAMERAINYTQARIHDRPEYSDSVRSSG